MSSPNEIAALLRLIDDPDDEIFNTVATKILDYGKEIIPKLEQLWEVTEDEEVQKRIELLIHRGHFNDLQQDFLEWSKAKNPELLRGAILIARYHYPELNIAQLLTQFDKLKKDIWLELNNYMSPLEQVNVINSILYDFYKLHGHELTERNAKYFFINNLLESKQGNAYSLGIVYLALCELLDIPIFAVDVPRQFIFGYIDIVQNFLYPNKQGIQKIQFYIDPTSGILYTQKDVDTYLKKINANERELYFTPINTKRIIHKMMEELALCYRYNREEQKAEEIQQLMQLLIEHNI